MTVSFRRQQEVLINAPAEVVFDIVSNPHRRPFWYEASHKVDAPDRPAKRGERFREEWRIRRGIILLDWIVLDDERPSSWTIRADTDLLGPIVVRYCFEQDGEATRCIHHASNPRRPSEPSSDQVQRIDEDISAGLTSLKRYVEDRMRRGA
jgi:uncharacterized protein YndB with AHSA1/START domain